MADGPAKSRLTAAMLREDGWRLLDQSRATHEPRLRRQLARQALDLAQVAEMMDASDQRSGRETIIPAPRRLRRLRALAREIVPPEQDGSR